MGFFINISLMFVIAVGFIMFVYNMIKKNKEAVEDTDIRVDDKTYNLDTMIDFIKRRLD